MSARFPFATECSHSICRHTILAHLFFRDFSFPSLFSYSPRLSLFLSHFPFSLSASFPPFLAFHLRLFNLFNDHSPSPLSSPDFNRCTNSLSFLCTERTVEEGGLDRNFTSKLNCCCASVEFTGVELPFSGKTNGTLFNNSI